MPGGGLFQSRKTWPENQSNGRERGRAKPGPVSEAPAREPAPAIIIAKRIEEDIVLGRRQPRERLIEQDLCDLFQTHRGDVRLALFELEKRGLVERIPNRGAMVRGLTPLEVREIYAVREELEVMAVRIIPFPVAPKEIDGSKNYSGSTARPLPKVIC